MKNTPVDFTGPLQRRDLIAVLSYVNRSGRAQKSVDGTFGNPKAHLRSNMQLTPSSWGCSS
jgi:hypothetical protein